MKTQQMLLAGGSTRGDRVSIATRCIPLVHAKRARRLRVPESSLHAPRTSKMQLQHARDTIQPIRGLESAKLWLQILIRPKMTQNESFRDNLKSALSPINVTLFLRGGQFATNRRYLFRLLLKLAFNQ